MSEAGTGFADDSVERAYPVLNVHFARLREQPRAAKVFLLEITGLSESVDTVGLNALRTMRSILLTSIGESSSTNSTSSGPLLSVGAMGAVINIALRWVSPAFQSFLPVMKPGLIFECVGIRGLLRQVFESAPRAARVVVVDVCMENDRSEPLLGIMEELSVQYVYAYTPEEFASALRLIVEGQVDAPAMIRLKSRSTAWLRPSPISAGPNITPRSLSSRQVEAPNGSNRQVSFDLLPQ